MDHELLIARGKQSFAGEIPNHCAQCGIRELCLGSGLDALQVSSLAGVVVERRRIQQGKVLYEQGTPFTHLYAIASGSSKAVVYPGDGRGQTAALALRGDLVGFLGVGSGVHTVTLVALENSVFCVIPYNHLLRRISQDRNIGVQFHRLVARVMTQRQEAFLFTASTNAERRVGGFVLWFSDQLAARKQHFTEFSLPVSRTDIADFVGLRLETVSRAFTRLHNLNLIEARGRHVRIPDVQILRKWFSASR
ncbi:MULTISPECIES: helix-turn-helix domain-containing protein [Paraburkholderia]|uniref:CRP/FNR family transcriptional regulator n=2 Tax=Paraburkholderia TaxID=1822464 RepID=A0A7Y9WHY7_9BURK|nr:helix-turn-helix domain-containing protein [Paraburkholderia bryophila]NYH20198.1 CRP/FNR family transcriptional regulator [Paraburkholderia bryophila]NYH20772.1 CRP/FNR family transcriptional regulator [Paraburkholderia bryophila]